MAETKEERKEQKWLVTRLRTAKYKSDPELIKKKTGKIMRRRKLKEKQRKYMKDLFVRRHF